MLATHEDAERRYEKLRRVALEVAQRGSLLRLNTIDSAALGETAIWANAADRRVDWDWVASFPTLKFRYPKRFEVAVWSADKLAALSFGRPTYNGHSLRMDFVEARPKSLGDRPLVFEEIEMTCPQNPYQSI